MTWIQRLALGPNDEAIEFFDKQELAPHAISGKFDWATGSYAGALEGVQVLYPET